MVEDRVDHKQQRVALSSCSFDLDRRVACATLWGSELLVASSNLFWAQQLN
jgi:hypothetical protein